MKLFSKIAVVLLILLGIFYVKDKFFSNETREIQEEVVIEEQKEGVVEQKSIETVKIYFITTDKNGMSVFKTVKREAKVNVNKLKYAVDELLKGPSSNEKKKNIYSEIPKGTKLLGVIEGDSNIIINLSSDFQYGGGTDSIYSRIRQLIKTVMACSPEKNVYLYLDGKQADVIGGEGIMIDQPLSENSLHD